MFEDMLICEVQKYPLLYNKSDKLYCDKLVKKKVWEKIATAVRSSQEHCYSRWKSLRDRYVRETTRQSFENGAQEQQKEWKYTKALSFLKEHVTKKKIPIKKKYQLDIPLTETITTKCINRINIHSYCRTCLKELESTSSNNELKYDIHQTQDLAKWILICTSIEVDITDGYPNYLCLKCFTNFHSFYKFRAMCIRSMRTLDKMLDTTDYVLTDAATSNSENFHVSIAQPLGREETRKIGFEIESLIDPLEKTIEDNTPISLDIKKFEDIEFDGETEVLDVENKDSTVSDKYSHTLELDHELNAKNVESSTENLSLKEELFTPEIIEMEKENSDTEVLQRDLEAYSIFKPFQCNQCERAYTRESYLKVHIRKSHQDSRDRDEMELNEDELSLLVEQSQKKSRVIFQCEVCTKRYYSQDSLALHMQVHQGLKRFQCSQCERSYKNASHLTAHIREIHQQSGEPFSCDFDGCDKQFKNITSYRGHCRVNHINCKRFICEDCGRIYKHFISLKNHRLKHSSVAKYPFECDQCGKGYIEKRRYKQHLLGHTEDKKYACTYCGVKKSTRSELLDHIKCHTKENQWPCPHCPIVFNSSAQLCLHDRVIHNGVRRYACHYCDQRFTNSHTLKYHEMRHTGEKPHECHICNRRFRHVQAMRTHLKTHNKVGGTNSTKRKKNQSSHTVTSEEATNLNI